LANPANKKAAADDKDDVGIDNELFSAKIDPAQLAAGRDAAGRGAWLRRRPIAARVKGYFFSHGGRTDGRSIPELKQVFGRALGSSQGFAHADITGDDSILEARDWFDDPKKDKAGMKEANALGVDHLVFGHDPNAFDEDDHIATSKNNVLIKIDCKMGLDGNPGQLLHITTRGGQDTAEKVKLSGNRDTLY
jgi:hypothetical protein